jgi:sulfur relay (sulfurtransferase) DsrF/TusC family protein
VRSCLIDGEVVCCDEKGLTSFQLLRHRRNEIILARSVSDSKGVLGTLGILSVFVCPPLRSLFRNVRLTDCWTDRPSA